MRATGVSTTTTTTTPPPKGRRRRRRRRIRGKTKAEIVVKISDFSVSCKVTEEDDLLDKTEGSPAFLAPEIISGGKYSGRAIDVWALGITLYVFIFGRPPFMAQSEFAIYEEIRTTPLTFSHPIDPQLESLLRALLEKDPAQRIRLDDVFTHPWVTMGGAWPLERKVYGITRSETTLIAKMFRQPYSPLAGHELSLSSDPWLFAEDPPAGAEREDETSTEEVAVVPRAGNGDGFDWSTTTDDDA